MLEKEVYYYICWEDCNFTYYLSPIPSPSSDGDLYIINKKQYYISTLKTKAAVFQTYQEALDILCKIMKSENKRILENYKPYNSVLEFEYSKAFKIVGNKRFMGN